jgi:transcriptional regulator GlxA family with amidase domain
MAEMVFVAVEGCFFSSIANMIDAFGIANRWSPLLGENTAPPPFQTRIVTSDGLPVLADGHIKVQPDGAIGQVDRADVIFLPAFPTVVDAALPAVQQLLPWLIDCHGRGITLAAMCTGAFLLAETGLLEGKQATTHWQFSRLFQRRYPRVGFQMHRMLTEQSGLICTGATTAIYNLALHLIRRYGSEQLASVCGKAFLIDPQRTSQAPYAVYRSPRRHGDRQVIQAQEWMEKHYAEGAGIDAIAEMVGISPRHFKRRFRKATGESPLAYLQALRIEAAKTQLATTQANVNEITYMIGYEDSSTFRRLFKKQVGISPREYREKFFSGKKAA